MRAGRRGIRRGGHRQRRVEGARTRNTPGFDERLFDDKGELRRFVNVFVADEDIRFMQGVDTALDDGTVVSIIPAVAGG